MPIYYPQPIRSELQKQTKTFKAWSDGLSERLTTGGIDLTVADRDLLTFIQARDKAMLAIITALDDVLVYLDSVKPEAAPGSVRTITPQL